MKIRSISLICMLALTLLAFGCNGKTTPSVAIVNTDRVYKESDPGKAGIAHLDGISNTLQAELTELQKKAEASSNKKVAQTQFQQALMSLQQRFSAEQQQVITTLNEVYQKALENSRAKYKVDVIMASDTVLSASPEADFTDKVINEMNAISATFKPLAAEGNGDAAQEQPAAK